MKILISLFQIVANLPSILHLNFPYPFNSFARFFGWLNMSFFEHLGLNCFQRFDYVDAIMLATLLPIGLTLVLFGISMVHDYVSLRGGRLACLMLLLKLF